MQNKKEHFMSEETQKKSQKENHQILQNKKLEDLKKIAASMGLDPKEDYRREDYYLFISKGIRPEEHKDDYSSKEYLSLKTILQLREIADFFHLKQPYKYRKEELIEKIIESAQENQFQNQRTNLEKQTVLELRKMAQESGIASAHKYKKEELVDTILDHFDQMENEFDSNYDNYENTEDSEKDKSELTFAEEYGIDIEDLSNNATEIVEELDKRNVVCGVLDLHSDGYGFLRVNNYLPGEGDIYVSPSQIRRFRLRNGDQVGGVVRPSKQGESYNALIYIKEVNGQSPNSIISRPYFDNLKPIYPKEKMILETEEKDSAMRMMDLICPIGKGQRGLIVSQPKSGKTTLLKKIAHSISTNYPDVHLMVLLIDERPEEVTDMQNSVKGEVIYSTFDEAPKNHTRVAEMVIDRAKRLVEQKKDVVILLDSLTRLSRAYNLITPFSGKTLSGGLDPLSLHKPKRFFGAARNIEEGGSLTILATALIETGSRMDDIIFEEFKGTGNMEVHLDRKLSERRIFPAIDIYKSGTRKEELLLNEKEQEFSFAIRNAMSYQSTGEITEILLDEIEKSNTNKEFLKITKLMKISDN